MREPPPQVSDAQVLTVVRAHWDADLTSIVHLPVGFGAHHWRATGPAHEWFVTLDRLLPRHTAATLDAAYAGAAELAGRGLEFVLAPRASAQNAYTVPLVDSAVSVTPWRDGVAGDGSMTPTRAATTREWLDRLHGATPPAGLPRWRPLVGEGLADGLMDRTRQAWDSGPYGERARTALRERMPEIAGWVAAYHRLAVVARERSWVSTHGEPHTRNQLDTPTGAVLVDWESLKLAPRERDLRSLAEAGHPQPDADPAMLEMFDLEWRLDEIAQYAAWFEAPHAGTEDDRIAIGGLLGELGRE